MVLVEVEDGDVDVVVVEVQMGMRIRMRCHRDLVLVVQAVVELVECVVMMLAEVPYCCMCLGCFVEFVLFLHRWPVVVEQGRGRHGRNVCLSVGWLGF